MSLGQTDLCDRSSSVGLCMRDYTSLYVWLRKIISSRNDAQFVSVKTDGRTDN